MREIIQQFKNASKTRRWAIRAYFFAVVLCLSALVWGELTLSNMSNDMIDNRYRPRPTNSTVGFECGGDGSYYWLVCRAEKQSFESEGRVLYRSEKIYTNDYLGSDIEFIMRICVGAFLLYMLILLISTFYVINSYYAPVGTALSVASLVSIFLGFVVGNSEGNRVERKASNFAMILFCIVLLIFMGWMLLTALFQVLFFFMWLYLEFDALRKYRMT